ncbi:UDP-N-acetylglucosamine 1-carboxyvinyltransferase [Oscillatoria sp. CS-180]|uniref:UDP-N-acetylglucosamine 1-carboxyvinyltransferase n=1 Tax=Oscillatoria sp. CS-180 TaxID=3021720 RepID=UPI00232B3E19|nr:UDP-N-acetylglucosamine 1-carboxyvinyltransferase [Oscillatoria sp. CS-180]MDB9525031.1 UDP-N-acetylglucosamine 1-carboxyvinyltransferase [Oscillatoria sp. CS-180]
MSNSPEADDSVLEIRGQHPLSGHIKVSGAKNSALVVMAGTLLCSQACRLRNIPDLVDVERMAAVLTALGVKVTKEADCLDVDPSDISHTRAPYEIVSKLRASFFVIGPLLARMGVARIPLPGGCAIGARPVELHVRGLQAMGADVQIEHGTVHACIPGTRGRLQGAKIYLDYPSVGATETLMMAATLADGETIIDNAAQEPEVADLANFCRAMGARIRGVGTKTLTIVGVPSLHSTEYAIIPDRIEAGTFLIAGAITRSTLTLSPVVPEHLGAVIAKLREAGSDVQIESHNRVRLLPGEEILPTDIQTLPYPGFPTDMQAQFMALMTLSNGNSLITETVFENRLRHVAEFNRMGANIRVNGNCAVVQGSSILSGAPVMATDLRASAALVLAGLGAHGTTVMSGLHHLDRGYERLERKLTQAGARITRIDGQSSTSPSDVTHSTVQPSH